MKIVCKLMSVLAWSRSQSVLLCFAQCSVKSLQ